MTSIAGSTTPHLAQGIILFAHGSRDPLWAKPLQAIAHAVSQRSQGALVHCAFLELMKPDLASTAALLAEQGVHAIRIVPMFLGVGVHAREDLPVLVKEIQAAHPQIQFELMPAIGEHPELIEAMAKVIAHSPT